MAYKVYVCVTLFVSESGFVTPLTLFYEDKEYVIDKVTARFRTIPKKVGGLLTERFDCKIGKFTRSLYLEQNGRWFIEVDKNS